jgi:hypothetical protein
MDLLVVLLVDFGLNVFLLPVSVHQILSFSHVCDRNSLLICIFLTRFRIKFFLSFFTTWFHMFAIIYHVLFNDKSAICQRYVISHPNSLASFAPVSTSNSLLLSLLHRFICLQSYAMCNSLQRQELAQYAMHAALYVFSVNRRIAVNWCTSFELGLLFRASCCLICHSM